jgi:hypothetical protein
MQVKPAVRRVLAVCISMGCAFGVLYCAGESPVAPKQRSSISTLSRSLATDSTLGVSVLSLKVSRFKTSGFYPFSASVSGNGTAPYKYNWYVSYCYLDGSCQGQVLVHVNTRTGTVDTAQIYVTSDMSWIRATAIVGDSHSAKTLWGDDDKEIINFYGGGSGDLTNCWDDPSDKTDIGWPFQWNPGAPYPSDGFYRVDECNPDLAHWHVGGDTEFVGNVP